MKKECVICGGRYNKCDLIEGCCSNQCLREKDRRDTLDSISKIHIDGSRNSTLSSESCIVYPTEEYVEAHMKNNYTEKYEKGIVSGGKHIKLYDEDILFGVISFYPDNDKLLSEAQAMLLKPYQSKSNDSRFLFLGKDCVEKAIEFLREKYEEGIE